MSEDMPQGKQSATDDEIIEVMSEDGDPIHSASEVAEMIGVTRQCAFNRLQQLKEEGRVRKKKSGSRSVVWWPEDN
jgi:DNA-binding Lrp family transcriptional regulator